MRGDREVYTPQAVVNGEVHVIGSDRDGIESAIGATRKKRERDVGAGHDDAGRQANQRFGRRPAKIPRHARRSMDCSISKAVPIAIGRGENRGRKITYHNVVRNLLKVGDWNGSPANWTVPLENISREGVDAAAVYVQDGNRDRPGPMLGAAYTTLH